MRRKPHAPIPLKIYASSHGCDWHGLPKALKNQLKDQRRFAPPVFNAKGGRKIAEDIVQKIIFDMNSGKALPQCIWLILGKCHFII